MGGRAKKKTWPIRGYLPKLLNKDGVPVCSVAEAANVRQSHVASIEAAQTMTPDELAALHKNSNIFDFTPDIST
eukprot:10446227-Karenia_brevis.AAC.1